MLFTELLSLKFQNANFVSAGSYELKGQGICLNEFLPKLET